MADINKLFDKTYECSLINKLSADGRKTCNAYERANLINLCGSRNDIGEPYKLENETFATVNKFRKEVGKEPIYPSENKFN